MRLVVTRVGVVAALASAMLMPSPAAAQYGSEGGFIDDGSADYEEAPRSRRDTGGPSSLDEARASRRGLRIGAGRTGTTNRSGNISVRPASVPSTYTVRRGDTLWDITGHYYGNPWEWPRVWSYNPEITNPHWIYPMDTMRLSSRTGPRTVLDTPGGAGDQGAGAGAGGAGDQGAGEGGPGEPGSVFLRDEGYLDRDALRTTGIIVGSPEEHMLLSPYDEVYVQFEGNPSVRAGQTFTVFRAMNANERQPNEQGTLVRIFGAVRVRSYDRDTKLARAVITEALDPIERGYRVGPLARRFDNVPPVRNDRDLRAQVVAVLRPRELVGDQQVIFFNVGSRQGVREGNRFFVVRRGDAWRETVGADQRDMGASVPAPAQPRELPDEVIAEVRVVTLRPTSCAGLVTRSTREVTIGDRAELRRGY